MCGISVSGLGGRPRPRLVTGDAPGEPINRENQESNVELPSQQQAHGMTIGTVYV